MIWNRVKIWRPTGDAAPEGGHLGREPLGTLPVAPRLGDAVIQPQLQLIRPPMSCHTQHDTDRLSAALDTPGTERHPTLDI